VKLSFLAVYVVIAAVALILGFLIYLLAAEVEDLREEIKTLKIAIKDRPVKYVDIVYKESEIQ